MKLPDDFDIDSLPVIGEGAAQTPQAQAAPSATGQSQQQQSADFDLDSLPELPRIPTAEEKAAQFEEWKRRRDAAQAALPDERQGRGFFEEMARGLFTNRGLKEVAAENWSAKPAAYINDLANSLVGGLIGGGAKIEEATGHLIGNNEVGNAIVNDARAGQAAIQQNLPTDTLDTSGGGVLNTVLQTGKGVAHMTGEFAPAMIPGVGAAVAPTVVSAGSVNRYAQVHDAAIENGMSEAQATGLATGAASVDALQNLLLMRGFKGIWTGATRNAADAAKRGFVRRMLGFAGDTAKTGATMSGGGMAQDVINQNVGIGENGEVGKILPYDFKRTADVGVKDFIEGGLFHAVNAGVHALPKAIEWSGRRSEVKSKEVAFVADMQREALNSPEGRALVFANNPEAARAILEARREGKDVSRKMIKELGLVDAVAPSVADRNALGDAIVKDYDAYKELMRRTPDEQQSAALDAEISGIGAESEAAGIIRDQVLSKIKDAKELDDPKLRADLVLEATNELTGGNAGVEGQNLTPMDKPVNEAMKERFAAQDAASAKAGEAPNEAPREQVSETPVEAPSAETPKDATVSAPSVVKNKRGEPIQVYHYTKADSDFTTFDRTKSGPGMYGDAFYFFTDRKMAENWGNPEGEKRKIKSATLDIKRPYVDSNYGYEGADGMDVGSLKQATDAEYADLVAKLKDMGYEINPEYSYGGKTPYIPKDGKMVLANHGLAFLSNALVSKTDKGQTFWKHSNAIRRALAELGYDGVVGELDGYTQIAAFDPSQIKLTDAQNAARSATTGAPSEKGTITPTKPTDAPRGAESASGGVVAKKPTGKGNSNHGQGRYSRKNYDETDGGGSTGAVAWHEGNGGRIYNIPVDFSQTNPGGKVVLKADDTATERIKELLNGHELVMSKSGKIQFKGEFKGSVPVELRRFFGRELKIGKNPDGGIKRDSLTSSDLTAMEELKNEQEVIPWSRVEEIVDKDYENYKKWQSSVRAQDKRAAEERMMRVRLEKGKISQNEFDVWKAERDLAEYREHLRERGENPEENADYKAMKRDLEVMQESGVYDYESLSKAKDKADKAADKEWEKAIGDIESGSGDFTPSDEYVKPFSGENLRSAKKGDIIHFDHDEVKYELDRYDPETGVMEVYRSDENGVKRRFKVSKNGIEEIKNELKGQKGVDENNAGDARGGGRPATGAVAEEAARRGGAEGARPEEGGARGGVSPEAGEKPNEVAELTKKAEALAKEYAALPEAEKVGEKGKELEKRIEEAWKAVEDAEARSNTSPSLEDAPKTEGVLTEELKKRGMEAVKLLKGESGLSVPELKKRLAVAEKMSGPVAERRVKALRDYIEYKEASEKLPKKEKGAYRGLGSPAPAERRAEKPAEKRTVADEIAELDRLIAEDEAGMSPSDKAEGLPQRSESFASGPGVKGWFKRLVSKNSIVRAIKDNFPEFAIRGRNTTNIGKNYSGHFEPWRELIRSKDMSSIDTIPHEIGHGISMLTRRRGMAIPQDAKRELAQWGRDIYGNKRPAGGYMEEGFAEYVRGYMTGAEDLATQAPALHRWFTGTFADQNPDYVRRMDAVRREVMRWTMQSDIQKMAAMMKPETTAARRAWDTVMSVFTQEAWNDEGATLTKAYKKSGLAEMHKWQGEFRELEKLVKAGQGNTQQARDLAAKISEKILSDPRIFASNARGTSKARVLDMAKHGITNLTGTEKIGNVTGFDANGKPIRDNVTESYRDIFGGFTKKELDDFDVYAAAKIGLENYIKQGKEYGADRGVLERTVAQLETPKFLNALERFTAFSRRALSVGLEAGALTPEQYQQIVGAHKYYVRTERRLADDGAGTGGRQANPIKAIKGSTRNIFPSRTATLMQIERQLRYFQTMKVLNMIARDVEAAEAQNERFFKSGGRDGAEYRIGANLPLKVANATGAVKFKSEKLRNDVTGRMTQAGVAADKAEAERLFNQLFSDGDDVLTVFKERPSNGKNGLVSTYIDGKLVTFELPDRAWERYITGMEKGEGGFDNKVVNAIWNAATAPGKVLRLGATTLNPVFALANFNRDAMHSAIMSETGAKPLVSSVVGMMNDVLGKDAGRLFKSMGGEMSMLMGSNPESQMKHVSDVALANGFAGQIMANTSLMNPLRGFTQVTADALSKPEIGPRVREMMGVLARGKAAGISREASAWLAFAAGKDISIDFGKHGYIMKRLNQLLPYTNAWYRGLEQFARNFGMLDALPTQFEERGGVRAAKTAGKALMWLTATAVATNIAKMLVSDDKEKRAQFKKNEREKWDYDDVFGVRVPLPFELGSVFYAIPKAIVYESFGDKGAVREAMWHAISSNLGKYAEVNAWFPTIISPFIDNLRNEKWDESPVVTPQVKENFPKDKQMWYDHSTTSAAKWVGEKLGWAPAHIDHVMNTWSGGMWKRFLSPSADSSIANLTGASAFIPRPTARRDVRDFYDFREEAQSHYNAGNLGPEDYGRLKRANKLHEELAPMFKEMRELSESCLSSDERRKRREEIMDKVFDKIHDWSVEDADDRKLGVAKAAESLTASTDITDDVRDRSLAVLKGVSPEEARDALREYGREVISAPVRNGNGKKTGRMKRQRRWSSETTAKRLKRLNKILSEQD